MSGVTMSCSFTCNASINTDDSGFQYGRKNNFVGQFVRALGVKRSSEADPVAQMCRKQCQGGPTTNI